MDDSSGGQGGQRHRQEYLAFCRAGDSDGDDGWMTLTAMTHG
jgi:hypothetical protein